MNLFSEAARLCRADSQAVRSTTLTADLHHHAGHDLAHSRRDKKSCLSQFGFQRYSGIKFWIEFATV